MYSAMECSRCKGSGDPYAGAWFSVLPPSCPKCAPPTVTTTTTDPQRYTYAGWYNCSCRWTAYADAFGKSLIEEHHAQYGCKMGVFTC